MRTILRSHIVKQSIIPIRGGHGWARPDVPLVQPYQHKRQLSIFDSNVWFYDNAAPEYMVTYQDQHLHDHWNTFNAWGQHLVPFLMMVFGIAGYFWVFVPQHDISNVDDRVGDNFAFKKYKRVKETRINSKKNFLGMSLTNEDGIIHASIDRPSFQTEIFAHYENGTRRRKEVNVEGKNFILKVENEAKAKYQNWTGEEENGHGHGH